MSDWFWTKESQSCVLCNNIVCPVPEIVGDKSILETINRSSSSRIQPLPGRLHSSTVIELETFSALASSLSLLRVLPQKLNNLHDYDEESLPSPIYNLSRWIQCHLSHEVRSIDLGGGAECLIVDCCIMHKRRGNDARRGPMSMVVITQRASILFRSATSTLQLPDRFVVCIDKTLAILWCNQWVEFLPMTILLKERARQAARLAQIFSRQSAIANHY